MASEVLPRSRDRLRLVDDVGRVAYARRALERLHYRLGLTVTSGELPSRADLSPEPAGPPHVVSTSCAPGCENSDTPSGRAAARPRAHIPHAVHGSDLRRPATHSRNPACTNRHGRPDRFRVSRVECLTAANKHDTGPARLCPTVWLCGAERATTRHREARMMPGIDGHRRVERHHSAPPGGESAAATGRFDSCALGGGSERAGVATRL